MQIETNQGFFNSIVDKTLLKITNTQHNPVSIYVVLLTKGINKIPRYDSTNNILLRPKGIYTSN